MAIANYYEQKPLMIFTFKKLCNGEQRLAAQHYPVLAVPYAPMAPITSVTRTPRHLLRERFIIRIHFMHKVKTKRDYSILHG